jgi:hypothetical protein
VPAQDHSIERVQATLELVWSEPQFFERVEVHEIEVTTTIHEGLGEPGCPNQRVDDEGKSPWLEDAIQAVSPVESD